MESFHTIAPYCSLCQYRNRGSCSSAVCRHCQSLCGSLPWVPQSAHCKVDLLAHGFYHPAFASVPKPCKICMSKTPPTARATASVWALKVKLCSFCFIHHLSNKSSQVRPSCNSAADARNKTHSLSCHWLGRGSRNKNQKPLQ